jgi:hypothetical protein
MPPMPFVIEILIIPIGLVWLLIDTIRVLVKRTQTWKDILGHVVGLIINAGFVIGRFIPFSIIDISQ